MTRRLFAMIALLGIGTVVIAATLIFVGSDDLTSAQVSQATPTVSETREPSTQQRSEPGDDQSVDSIFDDRPFTGGFAGAGPFTVLGDVVVATDDLGQSTLTLTQDFRTNRGQELVVYLRADNGQFVSLGNLQAVSGRQAYAIPGIIDLEVFDEVQIFDEPFGTLYGSAILSPI